MDGLILGMLFGSIGTGYMVYGKNEQRSIALACGIGLWLCPYAVTNVVSLTLLAIVLMILPFYFRF